MADADEKAEEKPENDIAATDAPPEVEAEIVDAEFSEAPGAGPFAAPPGGEEKPKDASPKAPPAKTMMQRLRAGKMPAFIIFAVFIILVVGLFSFFVFERKEEPPTSVATEKAGSATTPTVVEQRAPATAPEETPAPADASKITNDLSADAKKARDTFDPSAAPPSTRTLPPPPPADSGNEAFQQGAKEALKTAGDNGDAIDAGPPPGDGPKIDFSIEGQEAAPDASPPQPDETIQPQAENNAAPGADHAGVSAAAANIVPDDFSNNPPAQNTDNSAAIDALRQSFEEELAKRDARANAEIADLRHEVETLKAGFSTASTDNPAAAVALAQLERVVDRGAPYADQLNVLAHYTDDSAAVKSLRPMAASGAPTIAALQQSFDPAARAALAAARREGATGFSGILARFPQLFSARPATPQEGSTAPAIVSRAEADIDKGDVSGAVRELSALQGAGAEAFAPWMEKARARLAADRALTALNQAFISDYQN